ncbi:conserved Plasmodium protein, unknown function [Plasmodium relictum]|uniref:Uncharacterized protein n=1 Tax=Plasmodium relictum TaxID=85471 RepID=A0A1J1H8A7_PLARL|nr:conserved Plasmodium protein, unknown function [Plasmodium relictum]CRH01130.1 conserved Plasmodium protein, unknown function [Plasmodium relictum]
MNSIDYDKNNKTKLCYSISKSKNNENSCFLNSNNNNLKREINNESFNLHFESDGNEIKSKRKNIKNELLLEYELNTEIIKNFVDIDDKNIPYVNINYKNHINSKNILLIIDFFVYNLFFHLKNIGKNINNFYLSFNNIIYPFHFNFYNNICENCILKNNKNGICKENNNTIFTVLNEKNYEQARNKKPKENFAHNFNKRDKGENEFLPNILKVWCERIKYTINIYNNNKKNYKIKKYFLKDNEIDYFDGKCICEKKSRYSINECLNALKDIIFNNEESNSFKNVYFFPKEKHFLTNNNILKHNNSKKDITKSLKEESDFSKNSCKEIKINSVNSYLSEHCEHYSKLYDDNITDLYIINYIKCKIEDYFKNVEVKKFWDIVNVKYLTEFDYKNSYKKMNEKERSNSNKICYESIYDYIQIIKKNKAKKDIKDKEITEINKSIKKEMINSNDNFKKESLDKEFIFKDLFNNTIKNYNVNEVQIYLSSYDNIFLKSITRFYLLLNFSVELLSILYEDIDLYSVHIFSLYEKINEYTYNEECKIGMNVYEKKENKSNLKNNHSFKKNTIRYNNTTNNSSKKSKLYNKNANMYYVDNSDKNDKTTSNTFLKYNKADKLNYYSYDGNNSKNIINETSCINGIYKSCDIKYSNYKNCIKSNFPAYIIYNYYSFSEKKLDTIVFDLLKLLLKRKYDKPTNDKNNILNYLKLLKYKEILKEIRSLIKYIIKKKKNVKPVINYLLGIYNKYNDKIKGLNCRKITNSKYLNILKKNFLLYSLNFYSFEFFSNKDLYADIKKSSLPKNKKNKRKLKIPGKINKKIIIEKFKTSLKIFDFNKICSKKIFNYECNSIHKSNKTNIKIKINKKLFIKKKRMRYLRKLRYYVYSYFSSINLCFDSNEKTYFIFENVEDIFHNIYKNGILKTLNKIKIKEKVLEIIKNKNTIYKKVVRKMKEKNKTVEKNKLKDYGKYYKTFVDLLKIIKDQDEHILNNLFNMIDNINEQLNLFYTNICHCIPLQNSEKINIKNLMNQKIELLKEDINFNYHSETNLFHLDENSYHYDLEQKNFNNNIKTEFKGSLKNIFLNKNNKQIMNQTYENFNYFSEVNTKNDVHINNKTDEINNTQNNNNNIKNEDYDLHINNILYNESSINSIHNMHNNYVKKNSSNFSYNNLHNQNIKPCSCDCNFINLENKNSTLFHNNKNYFHKKKGFNSNLFPNSNDKKFKRCVKCNSMLDKNILEKKKKMFYNFFNLKKYYKKKKKKINYLTYDLSILKEYFYVYLKKYFDDIIILFEYFFSHSNNYFCIDTNLNNSFVRKNSENSCKVKNEELIYHIFALSNYDNFNNDNENILDYSDVKNSISIKDYNNYVLIKNLKLFVKNDIIQFISRSINLINNNVSLKIGNIKKAFNVIFRLLKIYNCNNEIFIFKILFSLILKYGKYCKKKIVKKNTSIKLSGNLNEYEIENDFLYDKKKKKFFEKFGIHDMSVSKDIISLLKYIVLCNKDKECTNEDIFDGHTDNINTNNSYGNGINNYLYNLSSYNEEYTLKNILHKLIRKKKKMLHYGNKIKNKASMSNEEQYLDHLSNIYEIIYPNNLKNYENTKLFITIEKKRKINRKRKLVCEDDLVESNIDDKNIKTKIKKVKKTVIKFIDDNKYVFPYIFNTFDSKLSHNFDYDIINLNSNFKFFHYINRNEYSFKNSILNYIYGYPLLYIQKNDDINNSFINNSNLEGILSNKNDKEIKQSNNRNNCHDINYNDNNNSSSSVKINLNNKINCFKNCSKDIETLNCKISKTNNKIDNETKSNSNSMFKIYNKKNINGNNESTEISGNIYENIKNKENDANIKKHFIKEFRRNKRRELINIFKNLNISNNIPLKYIHLCVIADIFKYLNLHHILRSIFKKLYEEKLKEIQEKFDSNNKHYLPKILIFFLLYFYSFLDIVYGIRDGNFINMNNNDNYNIFNNFNNMILKKKKKRKENNDAPNEAQKKSFIYLNNKFSKKNNYLWILKKKEKNDLSSYVDKIYLTLKKKKGSGKNKFCSNFTTFLNYYLDYNFSFLNNIKNFDENKNKNYLFVYNDNNDNDSIYENSEGIMNESLDINNNDTLLYKYFNISIHNIKENINYKKSSLYLSSINFLYFSQYNEKNLTFHKNYELIEKKDENEVIYNSNDSTSLSKRIEFIHDILRKYLKELLEKKKHCIIGALTNFKNCKKGLEDIKFIYHLIYLLNYGNKQNNSDFVLYKNLYYLLIEKLYNEKLNKNLDSEKLVYFILNLVKMTRIVKVRSSKMEKLFKLLQKYSEKFSDFHFNIFDRIFLFIYEDAKIENKIFLKSYFNKYFNDTKIILHIFDHILNSSKYRKKLLLQKDKNEEIEDIDINNSNSYSSITQKRNISSERKCNLKIAANKNNKNYNYNYNKITKYENPFSLGNFFRINNKSKETNLKKERSSNINQEAIKNIFLKYKNIYSSDSNSSDNNLFKIKHIRNVNYMRYVNERVKYIYNKINKNKWNKNKINDKYEENKKMYSKRNKITEKNTFINSKNYHSNNNIINDHNNKNQNINYNTSLFYEYDNNNNNNNISTHYSYDKRKERKSSKFLNDEIGNNPVNKIKNLPNYNFINENEKIKLKIPNKKIKYYNLNIKKHIEDYSSDEFFDFVNIHMYFEKNMKKKNDKKNNTNFNKIYFDDNSSASYYNSSSNDDYNKDNNKKKIFFYINDTNTMNCDKFFSLLSNSDIKNFKKNEDDNYDEKNEIDLLYSTQSGELDNNSNNKNYKNLVNFNYDNSFCFIKYKPYLQFNNKSNIEKKKQREKEKNKINKREIMCIPLYISIVGGIDVFLHKFNSYICDTYMNPYFYINTFYFEKYIRKKYKKYKNYDNYLIYDYYYYNYIFCNKFSSYYSYKAIKNKKIRANTYIKFFNCNIDTMLNNNASSNKENIDLNENEKIKEDNYLILNGNIPSEKNCSNGLVKDNKKVNNIKFDEVIIKKEGENSTVQNIKKKKEIEKNKFNIADNSKNNFDKSINVDLYNYEKKTSSENNKKCMTINDLKKGFDHINTYKSHSNFFSEEYEDNFFYTDNNLTSDDDEYRKSKKDINDIYILKRDLFIIDYLHNYFNFSILTRMKNIIEDMLHNYNLNLPYINKYIKINDTEEMWMYDESIKNEKNKKENKSLINKEGNENSHHIYSKSSIFIEKEISMKISKDVIHEEDEKRKKKNANKNYEENELELYDDNFNLSKKDSSKNIFYNSLIKEEFISKKIQISITVLNLEYWKLENLKEDDQIVKNLIPDSVQMYFDSINDIYQKKNGDKYLIFIYDLCYIDLNINDLIYTVKLSEGLLFLFLSNLENHTIDIYKNNLFYNDMKTNSNIYNYDYMFISSNYKHKDNKTVHMIVNDNIILYDFHIIKSSKNLFNVKKKKYIKKEPFEEIIKKERERQEEEKKNNNVINCNNKIIFDNKKGNNAVLKYESKTEERNSKKEGINNPKIEHYLVKFTNHNTNNENNNSIKNNEIEKKHNLAGVQNMVLKKNEYLNEDFKKEKSFYDMSKNTFSNTNQNNINTLNKQISKENFYYKLNFLKEIEEKEIEKIANNKNINDIYVKLFFTEEYLIQKTNISEKFIKEALKKLTRKKFLQKSTLKIMNKKNNKTMQFNVYSIANFDNLDDDENKNKNEKMNKSTPFFKSENEFANKISISSKNSQGNFLSEKKQKLNKNSIVINYSNSNKKHVLSENHATDVYKNNVQPNIINEQRYMYNNEFNSQKKEKGNNELHINSLISNSIHGFISSTLYDNSKNSNSNKKNNSSSNDHNNNNDSNYNNNYYYIDDDNNNNNSKDYNNNNNNNNNNSKDYNNNNNNNSNNNNSKDYNNNNKDYNNNIINDNNNNNNSKDYNNNDYNNNNDNSSHNSYLNYSNRLIGNSMTDNVEKNKYEKKKINRVSKKNKRINKSVNEKVNANNLLLYINNTNINQNNANKDSLVNEDEKLNEKNINLNFSSNINEPVDYFLDTVVTESDEEKEIKRRRTFDNLNLEESYEFYEKEILRITTERMNKMKSEPGKNTSTPLFLILNSLNKILVEKKLKKVTQQNVLAILNIMLKKNKITRIGGNWQPT